MLYPVWTTFHPTGMCFRNDIMEKVSPLVDNEEWCSVGGYVSVWWVEAVHLHILFILNTSNTSEIYHMLVLKHFIATID